MSEKPSSVKEYITAVPSDRKESFLKLQKTIKDNMPKELNEVMSYGMIGYVVPHSVFPGGYHCDPKLPLPFVSIANQKNFIAFYHMGMYVQKELYDWFVAEYPKHCKFKLDMGKSCVRFKKVEDIPFELIAQVMQKMSVQDWIELYETHLKK